jgi:hypothetical protein
LIKNPAGGGLPRPALLAFLCVTASCWRSLASVSGNGNGGGGGDDGGGDGGGFGGNSVTHNSFQNASHSRPLASRIFLRTELLTFAAAGGKPYWRRGEGGRRRCGESERWLFGTLRYGRGEVAYIFIYIYIYIHINICINIHTHTHIYTYTIHIQKKEIMGKRGEEREGTLAVSTMSSSKVLLLSYFTILPADGGRALPLMNKGGRANEHTKSSVRHPTLFH